MKIKISIGDLEVEISEKELVFNTKQKILQGKTKDEDKNLRKRSTHMPV